MVDGNPADVPKTYRVIAAANKPTSSAPSASLTVVTAPKTEATAAAKMSVQPSLRIGAVSHGAAAAWVATAVVTKKAGKVLRVWFRSKKANSGHRLSISWVRMRTMTTENSAARIMSRATLRRPLAKIAIPSSSPTPYNTPTP